jgi:flagellar assembly protein FliH
MAMRAAPAKYLFDNDFAAPGERKPSISLTEHAQKLKDAEAAGYARGFAAAQAAAKAEADQHAAAALERIAASLTALNASLAAIETRIEIEAIEVAVAVARKLAPALVAREPLAEISALATDCFRQLVASPHVVVRVNEAMHAAAREALEEIIRRLALESRLVILAEPDIAPGDCRIEWADGGIIRDSHATTAAIEQAVMRYVGARIEAAPISETPDMPSRGNP